MKKNNFTKGVFTALLLSSSVVVADSKYPAADFEPTVVYQNPEYTSSKSSHAAAPAASKHTTVPAPAAHSVADPKYPAANFEPKVVFHNPDIKADKSIPASGVAGSAIASGSGGETKTVSSVSKEKDSSSNYLFGLIALAAAGFFFFRNKSETAEVETRKAPANRVIAGSSGSLTGVARYLNKTSGTGVSRYVERQAKSAKTATGVARYMAKQTIAAKGNVSNVKAKTGVERYMRDRG